MEEAKAMKMASDMVVMQASDVLSDLLSARDFKYSHPAFLLLRKAEIDETASSKYLTFLLSCGYDCLFALGTLVKPDDNGALAHDVLRNLVGISNSMHREHQGHPKLEAAQAGPALARHVHGLHQLPAQGSQEI